MSKNGPIIIVDDDQDDQTLITEILESFKIKNEIVLFSRGAQLIDYLLQTSSQPFLIICDINMPEMSGLELRAIINADEKLRKKSIPFIFLSTSASRQALDMAYEQTVQGFFVKGSSVQATKTILSQMIDYWTLCLHPNS